MKGVFDFKCDAGHVDERYIDVNTSETICPVCLLVSKKQLSSPRLLRMDGAPININGDAWARAREKNGQRKRELNGE